MAGRLIRSAEMVHASGCNHIVFPEPKLSLSGSCHYNI